MTGIINELKKAAGEYLKGKGPGSILSGLRLSVKIAAGNHYGKLLLNSFPGKDQNLLQVCDKRKKFK